MNDNRPHIEILKDGVEVWNQWRRENPDIVPNLCLADLRNANLRFADLCFANLRNANLHSANLRLADLRNADLRNADLCLADLRNANLRNANLHSANLCFANLRNANLHLADLRNADLRFADLCNADLRYAALCNANLDFSCWPLWCGTNNVTIDKRIAAQLAARFCVVVCDDDEVKAAQAALMPLAKQFHEASELGLLERSNTTPSEARDE